MKTQPPTTQADTADTSALYRIRLATKILEGVIPIPGTDRKVGLDPIFGVLTGGGDALGFIMSAYILLESLRFRLPKGILLRMLGNVATDAIVGAVPFFGDVFDFLWRSNTKNLRLLEAHLENPQPQTAADKAFIILILIALVGLFALAIGLSIAVISSIGYLVGQISR